MFAYSLKYYPTVSSSNGETRGGNTMIDYSKVDFSKILTRYDVKKQVVETPEQVAAKMMPKDPLMKAVAEAVKKAAINSGVARI